MSFPDAYTASIPAKAAYLMAETGKTVLYSQLTQRSRRCARLMRRLGTEHGTGIAILMENHRRYLEIAWAAQRSGLRYTAVSNRLTPDEVAYILQDASVKILFVSSATADVGRQAAAAVTGILAQISVDPGMAGFLDYEELIAYEPEGALDDEREGADFLYSSGTTGRPKAISTGLSLDPIGTPPGTVDLFQRLYGFDEDTVYLSPAPLYHSAPLRFTMAVHRLGGTTVIMDRFEPTRCLELIERHRVTHVQMVPTMFVRLLRVPERERRQYDLSSLVAVIHAAAPCPPEVKRQMIDWLGPIVHEYYSATEIYLLTAIDSADWLAHPGSVGRTLLGSAHILDEDGRELPPGEPGAVWSENGGVFEYHNDAEKTST